MTDDIFTADMPGDPTWNVTRMIEAARGGQFGPPKRFEMTSLPPMTPAAIANIEWPKVHAMIEAHRATPAQSPLNTPAIIVSIEMPTEIYYQFADGNHRVSARRMLGMGFFTAYVVPPEMERLFRVHIREG